MKISLIAAMADKNRAIGKDNRMLWKLPEDLKRFQRITSGHPMIMGRKTFESLKGVLPNRTHIVLSRGPVPASVPAEVVWVGTWQEAIEAAKRSPGSDWAFVIGGGEIYRIALPYADRMDLTIVKGEFEGDATFPEFSQREFKMIEEVVINGTLPHMNQTWIRLK